MLMLSYAACLCYLVIEVVVHADCSMAWNCLGGGQAVSSFTVAAGLHVSLCVCVRAWQVKVKAILVLIYTSSAYWLSGVQLASCILMLAEMQIASECQGV